jgi:3-oxoacyl-[acyl-carrier protein] reductase
MSTFARYDLADRTALVTGAASGIGLATAELLAASGAVVALNYLPEDDRGPAIVSAMQSKDYRVIAAPGDVSEPDGAAAMVDEAIARLGRLDLLVNNAGTPATRTTIPAADLVSITEEFWDTILSTNLISAFRCTRRAAPALRESRGAVVSTASISGFDSPGSSLAYSAAKAGLVSLTKNLARALAPDVRVNAIAPGAVDSTWMVEWTEEQRRLSIEHALLKRRCAPEDLARVIVFLGFDAAMITGQTVIVDGGLSLGR